MSRAMKIKMKLDSKLSAIHFLLFLAPTHYQYFRSCMILYWNIANFLNCIWFQMTWKKEWIWKHKKQLWLFLWQHIRMIETNGKNVKNSDLRIYFKKIRCITFWPYILTSVRINVVAVCMSKDLRERIDGQGR